MSTFYLTANGFALFDHGDQPPLTKRTWFPWFREKYLAFRYGRIDRVAPVGLQGEQIAARFLRQNGFHILAHSARDRLGEIDLIATSPQRDIIIFLEVKTLWTSKPGHPADRVDRDKQCRITKAALRYLKRNQLLEVKTRFDVIAVRLPNQPCRAIQISHIEAAFDAVGEYQFFH
ncbi:YraN family protein [bacterium]|nr:YraN family protein [Rubripirellula sp.]MDB4338552.1 YraN family protein [Rubripirellula sp.]MDC0279122.1 YraN family protein [bacterium]